MKQNYLRCEIALTHPETVAINPPPIVVNHVVRPLTRRVGSPSLPHLTRVNDRLDLVHVLHALNEGAVIQPLVRYPEVTRLHKLWMPSVKLLQKATCLRHL
jgi:hypothetical protein